MIGPFAHLITLLALLVAVAGSLASFLGGHNADRAMIAWGRRSAFTVCGLVGAAVICMEVALVGHDFSVKYVAEVGSRETPLYYTIISLWGALEGSILWWAFLLSAYTVLFLWLLRSRFGELQPYAVGTLLAVSSFFLFVIVGPGNPFQTIVAPSDGNGPNPLLQNHWLMGIHPPLLYLGYVGLTIPFSVAIAALLRGTPSTEVFRLMRRWALVAWVFLSLGLIGGMWWSYAVLGWGGYWSWDPVENVALMPWLVTTAFLHSLQVQERRQMLKTWTVTLAVGAFLLSLLGTFLTRSGVLASVHSFTQSGVGPVFLAFLGLVLTASLALIFTRSREMEHAGSLDSVICRESAFLFNNLLLVALTFTVLLGTLFPLMAAALQGSKLSVGAPYFNHVAVPMGLAVVFLMGIGPVLPWGAARLEDLQYRLLLAVAVGVAAILGLLLLGLRGIGTLVTLGAVSFVIAVTVERVGSDIRARRRNAMEGRPLATVRLLGANPRRYGGYIAHIGLLLAILGIAASQSYGARTYASLRPGQTTKVAGYAITYQGLRPHPEPNRMVLAADISVRRGAQDLGSFLPSINSYNGVADPVVTPAVREEPWGMVQALLSGRSPLQDVAQLRDGGNPIEDLYLVVQGVDARNANHHDANRRIALLVLVNPMVGFIWLGGVLVALGGSFALLPARRKRRVPAPVERPAHAYAEEARV